MADKKIATWRWQDVNEEDFIFDLWSKTSSMTIILFHSITNCEQTTESDKDDYFDFIKTSSVKLSFLIHNATEEALINLIASANENDLYCHFRYLQTSIFKGYLVPEMVTIDNSQYPYEVTLTFTDSIGKLKETNYKLSGIDDGSVIRPLHLLQYALQTVGVHTIYDSDDIWLTIINGYTPDNLTLAEFYSNAFDSTYFFFDAIADNKKKSCYNVVAELCRIFHARLYYADGMYNIESIDRRLDTTYDHYQYVNLSLITSPNPTTVSQANITKEIDHTDIKILSGSRITFLPGIESVSLKFDALKNAKASILMPYRWDANHLTTWQVVGAIYRNEVTKIYFEFEYRFAFEWTSDIGTNQLCVAKIVFVFKLHIKQNGKYLKRAIDYLDDYGVPTYGAVSWEDTEEYYYYHAVFDYQSETSGQVEVLQPVFLIFETPDISGTGELEMWLEYDSHTAYTTNNFITYTDITPLTPLTWINVFNYLLVTNAENDPAEIEYYRLNAASYFKRLEFEGYYIDAPIDRSTEFIQIWDIANSKYIPVTSWNVDENGSDNLSVQELFVNSVSELRESVRKLHDLNLYVTDIAKYITLRDLIIYDSVNHLITSLNINFRFAEFTVQAVRLAKGVIANTATKTKDNNGNLGMGGNTQITNYNDGTETEVPITQAALRIIQTSEQLAIGARSTIPIITMYGNYYEGDFFMLRFPLVNYYQNKTQLDIFMLTADADDGDTVLNCTGTGNYIYPILSEVLFYERPARKPYSSEACTTYMDIPLSKGLLPDPAILSLEALRRKVRVVNQGVEMRLVLEADLLHYNDVAINGANLSQLLFTTDMTGNYIKIDFEAWENILPT